MRLSRAALLLVLLLAALAGPAQATTHRVVMHLGFMYKPHDFGVSGDAAAPRKCSTHGMPLAVLAITARDCARARTVVREWFHRLRAPGGNACTVPDGSTRPAVCTVRNWRCTSVHTVNGGTYPVTCTADRGRRRVHFVNRV